MPTVDQKYTYSTPVDNNATAWAKVVDRTYDIVPTGVAATDTVAFNNLVGVIAARADTTGVIRIMDNALPLVLDTAVSGFSGGISTNAQLMVRGSTPNAQLQMDRGFQIATGSPQLLYAGASLPSYATRGTFSAVTAGAAFIQGVSGITLAAGDYVILYSDTDAITGADPHLAITGQLVYGRNHPAELHRIARVGTGGEAGKWFLDDQVIDSITTAPQVIKVNMLSNTGYADLIMSRSDAVTPGTATRCFYAFRTKSFRWENIRSDNMPGYPFIDISVDAKFRGHTAYGHASPADDYGLAMGIANGYTVSDCYWYNAKHAFTTGGATLAKGGGTDRGAYAGGTTYAANDIVWSGGLIYRSIAGANTGNTPSSSPGQWQWVERVWGTPAHGVIRNCHATLTANSGSAGWVGFDTHSSGYNTLFDKCSVRTGIAQQTTIGYNTRSRKARFNECTADGNNSAYLIGFEIRGSDSQITKCAVSNSDESVRYRDGIYGGLYHNHLIRDCLFGKSFANAIRVMHAINNVTIARNICSGVNYGYASDGSGALRRTLVTLHASSTGTCLRENYMDKDATANTESVDTKTLAATASTLEMIGNFFRGYGTGSGGMGYYNSSGQPTDINTAYGTRNYTDN